MPNKGFNPVQELVLILGQVNLEVTLLPLQLIEALATRKITVPEIQVKTAEDLIIALERLHLWMEETNYGKASLVRGLIDLLEKKTADEVIALCRDCLPPPIEKKKRSVKAPKARRGEK